MGLYARTRAHRSKRANYRATRTRKRTSDLDQIEQDLLHKRTALENQEIDPDLPGLGQWYCVQCARYLETSTALENHQKSKVHRRRLKELRIGAYSHEEAQMVAGLSTYVKKQPLSKDMIDQPSQALAQHKAALKESEGV